MKKIFLYCCFIIVLSSLAVYGQTKTATPSGSTTDQDIQELKEKVASKVAEIRKNNNKALSGVVISNKDGVIKIKADDNSEYDVKLDEALTKYFQISGNQKKEIKAGDIKKDDYIIVTGVLADKSISANSIFIDEQYLVSSGKITQIDKENYSLKVITSAQETYSLDIETYTKEKILNIKTLNIEQIGFSKIKEGDTIHFVVKKTTDSKDNKYSAEKILIIPQEYFLK